MRIDFALVVVKGLIEHRDGAAYFGSHGGDAVARGLITTDGRAEQVTEEGRRAYQDQGLARLLKSGRAYLWNWAGVGR